MRDQEEPLPACSFCLKPKAEVAVLVAGPGVYICDACVALCNSVIGARSSSVGAEPPPAVALWDAEAGLDEVMAGIPRVAKAGGQAEYTLAQYVGRARQLGASWAAIGQVMGITRQSAWERFASKL